MRSSTCSSFASTAPPRSASGRSPSLSAEGIRRSLDRAKDALKLVAQQLGDVERLEELTDDLLPRFAAPGGRLLRALGLLESAFVPLARGRWDEALDRLEEALELTRSRGYRYQEPMFVEGRCWLHRAKGDYEQAIEHGRSRRRARPRDRRRGVGELDRRHAGLDAAGGG